MGRMPRETFPGAACCQVTELPTDKAAPLQARLPSKSWAAPRIEDNDDYDCRPYVLPYLRPFHTDCWPRQYRIAEDQVISR